MNTTPSQRTSQLALAILALLASITALKFTSSLVLPILIAFFIATMIQPIMRKLKQYLPEGVSILVLLLLLGTAMLIATLMFVSNVQAISAKVPEYTERLHQMSAGAIKWAQAHGIQITWEQLGAQKGVSWALKFLTSGLTSVLSLTGQMVLVMFVLIFAMLELQSFQSKFQLALGDRVSGEVLSTLTSISERIQQYALTKTSVSLLTGICTWLVATLFGLDFAIFWGMLAFLLNYIPTIGSMIAVFPPVIIAFLQFGGWQQGLGVLTGLAAVQMIIGNILEPRMMGRSMNLSPLVVFLSMVCWGWLWDIAGMVMAVPLTVAIKIICEHIEILHPVAIILGDASAPLAPQIQEARDKRSRQDPDQTSTTTTQKPPTPKDNPTTTQAKTDAKTDVNADTKTDAKAKADANANANANANTNTDAGTDTDGGTDVDTDKSTTTPKEEVATTDTPDKASTSTSTSSTKK